MNAMPPIDNDPVVAIIIPLYNKARYITRALNSVLAQTYPHFEVLVIDDGSTDSGPELVSRYDDPRLRLILQDNAGPGAARNRGIWESQAPLLAFLDADDEWMPTFLERSLQWLQTYPDCVMSAAGRFLGAEQTSWEVDCRQVGIAEGPWQLPNHLDGPAMKRAIDFFHPDGIVCRREVIERLGGFYDKDDCNYGEDVYLWVQIALNYKIYRNPQPLFWWHTEASEISAYSTRKVIPPWPMVTDPSPLWQDCPPQYRATLQRYLTYLAMLATHRCLAAGNAIAAQKLLKAYPIAQMFGWEYLKIQRDFFLLSRPQLKQRLRRIRDELRAMKKQILQQQKASH